MGDSLHPWSAPSFTRHLQKSLAKHLIINAVSKSHDAIALDRHRFTCLELSLYDLLIAIYLRMTKRLTDAPALLPDADARTIVRRYRSIVAAIAFDQGGVTELSEVRAQLTRRFGAASVLAEKLEAALIRGEKFDVEQYVLLCGVLVRLASRIGLDRCAKNITPKLSDYLSSRQAKGDADGMDVEVPQ